MLNFKYNLMSTTKSYVSNVSYKLKVPTSIVDIIKNARNYKFDSVQKFVNSRINSKSQLSDIVMMLFRGFEELYDIEIDSEQINNVLINGFKTIEEQIAFSITSLAPLVEVYNIDFENNNYHLSNLDDLNSFIIKYVEDLNPDAYSASVTGQIANNESKSEINVKINLNDDLEFEYESNIVNKDEINLDMLISLNDLVKGPNFININEINTSYKKMTNKMHNDLNDYSKYFKNNVIDFYYEIRENSIEIYQPRYFNGISIFKRKSVVKNNFNDSPLCTLLLNEYIDKNISINKFMIIEFIKISNDFIKLLLNDKMIHKYLLDKEIMGSILRSNSDFIVEHQLNKSLLDNIIKNASLNQLPIIIKKLSNSNINRIDDVKTIMRIGNMNPKFLTEKQLQLFNDGQARKKKLENEYVTAIGKITVSGIRDNRKRLNAKEKKNFKIDKQMIIWINKNIGHNKGNKNKEITQEMVSTAKTILRKAESVSNYLSKKNK